ncbi:endonuclease domain-containing 1 protein-like [Protopterus annectens]|uniref:endonuclease domain-containing 1 protein-like n=1 Tax=Protopterus annectens TaxID=7888 RepID=UPI001CFB2D18|nr:endonuclease domain-containing 1 protein-like [Protopterus annectens]
MNALTFLLLAYVLHSFAEVLPNFNRCNMFFFEGKVPSGFSSAFCNICQRYDNIYHFATLYDTDNRIPVYSAYIYKESAAGGRHDDWKIEPQLADQNWPHDMMKIRDLVEWGNHQMPRVTGIREKVNASQAVNNDYTHQSYDRGHLNPVCHQCNRSAKDATFTLTNAAPMNCSLNRGGWRSVESARENMKKDCHNETAYIITGTSSTVHALKLHNRVAVPQYVWSAMCCKAVNGSIISNAAIGDNLQCIVTNVTVAVCEARLSQWFNSKISLFQGLC